MPKKFSKKPITSFNKIKTSPFREKVYKIVKKIPQGKVMSYKELAGLAGSPRAFRAVGNILNKSARCQTKIPCHRVVKSDGQIGGYNQGEKKKIALLKKEGIIIYHGKIAS